MAFLRYPFLLGMNSACTLTGVFSSFAENDISITVKMITVHIIIYNGEVILTSAAYCFEDVAPGM